MSESDPNNTATTNRTDSTSTMAGGQSGARTTTARSGSGGGATAGAKAEGQKRDPFIVDGKEVSEEVYLRLAGENGYDLSRMPANYRPPISTKKYGE